MSGRPRRSITPRLRLELSHRLGASWDVRPSGLGDVVGVDATLRRLFSGRASAIEEHLAGEAAHRAQPSLRRAFHATRPEKDRAVTVEDLVAEWKQRAVDFGYDLGDLTRVVGPRRDQSVGPIDGRRLQDRLNELAVHRRTLARHDLVAVVAAAAPAGVGTRAAEQVAAHLIEEAGPPVVRRPGRESTAHPGREREGVILAGMRLHCCAPSSTGRGRWRQGPLSARMPTSDGLVRPVVGRSSPRWAHDRSMVLGPAPGPSLARSLSALDLGR